MYIFAKSGYFFPIFEKGQGKPLSPPSSYAPDLTCHSYSIYFPFIKTLRRNIWKSTFKMMNIRPVTFYVRVHFLKWMLKFLQTCFSSFILISWNNLRKFPFCMFSLSNWSSLFKVHLKSASKAYTTLTTVPPHTIVLVLEIFLLKHYENRSTSFHIGIP